MSETKRKAVSDIEESAIKQALATAQSGRKAEIYFQRYGIFHTITITVRDSFESVCKKLQNIRKIK
jgi:hypothetical protein